MLCVSVVMLRLRDPEAERAFRLPLGGVILAVAAISCVQLLTQQPAANPLVALVIRLVLYAFGRFFKAPSSQG